MKASNIFGMAFHFMPRDLSNRSTDSEISRGEDITTQNNVIYLMTGTMPTTDELYAVGNVNEFEATYTSATVAKFNAQEFTYTYDRPKKMRTIKKTPDAVDFVHGVDGAITWAAVKLTDVDSAQADDGEQSLIFLDSVGTWSDTERAVVVESTDIKVTGDSNILKDFVLVVQDKLSADQA
jgi:hypothetical protein